MSFLLDPPALVLVGFIAGKVYYLLVAYGDGVLRRGASKKGLLAFGAAVVLVFWLYSSLLYVNAIYFPWPLPRWFGGTSWMLNSGLPLGLARSQAADAAAVVVFATYPVWFYLGTELALAGHRLSRASREKERNRIIGPMVDSVFPRGGAIAPGASDVGTTEMVDSLLRKIPAEFADGLMLLVFVFDSRFMVLFFTGRWERFVDLGGPGASKEKRDYVQAWDSNPYLGSAMQALRIAASYGYYTRRQVYGELGYSGPVEPGLPPWYDPGPAPAPEAAVGSRPRTSASSARVQGGR
ncbi:MAG: hypothetical protein ABSF83_15305 [Nitrososphaerales archaeon]